jgi:hypothetical protein
MCRFSEEQLRELKGLVAHPRVEQEGYDVREDFAQQSACQMPQIARPHPLHGVAASGELRKNGVYAVTKPALRKALLLGFGSSFLEE